MDIESKRYFRRINFMTDYIDEQQYANLTLITESPLVI